MRVKRLLDSIRGMLKRVIPVREFLRVDFIDEPERRGYTSAFKEGTYAFVVLLVLPRVQLLEL